MNCHYCQQECRPIQKGKLPNGLYENRIAHCDPCNVKYFESFHVVCCSIDTAEYSVSYMDNHPDHWVSIYHYDPIKKPKEINIALSFPFYVKFTPANFKEKLKLYLLFS